MKIYRNLSSLSSVVIKVVATAPGKTLNDLLTGRTFLNFETILTTAHEVSDCSKFVFFSE